MQKFLQRWDQLYQIALNQSGYFTLEQAKSVGFSDQGLYYHLQEGRANRVLRGVYRLVQFPHTEQEDLMALWLWSEQLGVFSHITALSLLQLSDILPKGIHMTLPSNWRQRRIKYPQKLLVYYDDVQAEDRTWFGGIPITSVSKTLKDCEQNNLDTDLLKQAQQEAKERGLLKVAF